MEIFLSLFFQSNVFHVKGIASKAFIPFLPLNDTLQIDNIYIFFFSSHVTESSDVEDEETDKIACVWWLLMGDVEEVVMECMRRGDMRHAHFERIS